MKRSNLNPFVLVMGLLVSSSLLAQEANKPSATPAPANAAAAPAVTRNIRFQFDGIPYNDVLERFAQMAKKPLLADTNVSGTLSFNDPNPYTYEEALDTLNLVLSMKGLMLVEAGHYLRLVPFKELPAMPLRILRGTDHAGDVRPGEVVTVVLDVRNIDAKEIADSITSMLSNAGSVAALSKGRGLIVTDRLSNIQRIRTLLATIDTESVVDRQMKTYTLTHSSGAIVSDLLNRTFGLATAPKRTSYNPNTKLMEVLPPDPNDYITSVYDDASRTLVLFGPRERVGLAEELINKFEQKDGPGGDVRIYYPQSIRTEELASMLRQAVPGIAAPGEMASTAATKARLITDTNQNRLIVAAPIPGQLEQIEQLINRVDKPVHGQPNIATVPLRTQTIQLTKVFRPRAAEATNLAQILTQALTRRSQSGQLITTASVSYDPGSQSVVLSGSPDDVQIATDIVTQLETGTSQPTLLQTRFIDVGSPEEAKRVRPLLEQLYRNEVSDGSLGAVAHAKILADTESGRLIVTASEAHLTRIEELVRQLRSDKPLAQARRLQIILLKNVRSDAALSNIQNLVNERMSEKRFINVAKPSLIADESNNRILVTATDDQIREIEQIVGVIDVVPDKPKRELTVLQLESKSATDIIPLVNQLLGQLTDDPSQLPPSVMAGPSGKQLIVLAAAKDLDRIRTLVKQFDTTPASSAPRQFRSVELFSRTASELAPLIQQLYQEQLRGQPEPAGGAATVIAEPKKNRIMISGPDKEIAKVETLVRQLDPEGRKAVKEETRVIRLRSGSASDMVGIIEKSLNGQQEQIRVMVDARSNSLVVTGDSAAVEAASQIIQQLDTKSTIAPRELRIFELKAAEASSLSPMLNNLFTEMTKDQRGADYVSPTKIVPDVTANRIVVTGVREELNQVAELVQQLDQAPDQAPGARVFKLNQAEATMLAPIVSNAMIRFDNRGQAVRRMTVTADEKSNSLIVSGTRSDLQDVGSVIEKLDGDSSGKERILRIFDVKSEDPDALAALTLKVFAAQNPGRSPTSLINITPEPASKRLIVLAPISMMPQVETVVTMLDSKPDQGARELQTVALKNSSGAAELLPKVIQIYSEQSQGKTLKPATVYADSSGSRFMVYGTREQAASVRQIVDTLETQARAPRETRTFEVGSANDVQRLQPLVQKLYQDQWKDRVDTDPADAQIMADQKTGRLIVTGKPDHIKQIESILQQLGTGKAKPEARDTRIYDLTTTSAVELATTVRTLYLEQAKGRFGTQVPDTLIVPDAGGNRLVVVAELAEFDAVEDIIKKLDKVSAQSSTARVFRLKSAEPDKVAEILTTALVRYDAYGRPQKRATVSVDAKTRTLIVTGDPKELQGVSVIIEQLDTSLGTQIERRMKVVTLKHGRTSDMSSKVRQLYNDHIRSQPELGTTEILIMEDATSNQLILAGSEAQLKVVEGILTELQAAQSERPPRESRLLELGSSEEVTRLLPMVQQLYQEQWKSKDSNDPADATLVADLQNARLIVTARTNQLAEIEAIVAKLRAPSTNSEPRETRVYDLSSTSASELVGTVKSLYLEQSKNRPVAAGSSATILPDVTANRIVVSGGSNELAIVEEIITKLDKVSAKTGGTQVFTLKNAEAEQVASVLSTALVRITQSGNRIPRVSVGADNPNNLLIVAGEPKDIQSAAVIIEQMDSIAAHEPREMRIIPLKSGLASEVSLRVRQLYQDQMKGRLKSGSAALIMGDDVSNRLIIAAAETQLKLIEEIVAKLQEAGEGTGRQLRVMSLERHSAAAISNLLRQLYARQIGSTDLSERLVVSPGGDDRTLVIEAVGPAFTRIEELVKTLDKAEVDGKTAIQAVHLKKGRAEDLAEAVNKSIASRTPGAGVQRVNVTAISGANSLLINGPTNALPEVLGIIRELDAETTDDEIEVRIYKLENGNAKEIQGVINQLLINASRQVRADPNTRAARATLSVDDRSNSLIVSGTAVHFRMLEKDSSTLDKAPERSDRDVQFVWLRKAKAYDVVSKLDAVFVARPEADRPVVEADSLNNSLTIIAKRGDMAQVQDLISRLDDTAKDSSVQVRLRPLERVAADQMARMLQNIYPQMTRNPVRVVEKVIPPVGEKSVPPPATAPPPAPPTPTPNNAQNKAETPAPEVVIAVDKDANALVLSGPAQELDNIDRIINELSFSFYGNESEFRMFPLKDADPVAVARALNDLLKQEPVPVAVQPGQPARNVTPTPRITIVPEPRTRSIIVRARPTDFGLIESIVKQLDVGGLSGQIEFRLIPLTNAPPEKVQPLVQQMVAQLTTLRPGEPVTVTIDQRSRGLLVVARDSVLGQVEKMIHSLDTPSANVEAEVLVLSLKHANASQLAAVLQNMLKPGAQGELPTDARELQEQVRRLKIQNDAGQPVVLDLTKPIKIATDPASGQGGGNRLVLTSTPDNLKALAAVVASLDTVALVEGVEIKLVSLKYADAAAVAQTVTTIFSQGRQLATGPGGPGAQPEGASGKALANPLTVASDPRSNTLIVTGQKETLDLAVKVIGDLDQQLDRFITEVKLFRLKHASATRLVPVLQSVFAEGPSVPGTEGLNTMVTRLRTLKDAQASQTAETAKTRSALVIQADELSNILIVAARSDTLPLIADVIDQLDIPAASGLETVRIYALNHADPIAIQRILNDLYTGPRAASLRNEDKPVISVDDRTSSLIIAGNGKSFAIIEGLLQQLDQKLAFDLRDIRVLPLLNADVNAVAATLQKLMDARITQRATLNKGQGDLLKVIILPDQRSNSLLIGGSRDSFELVETLAKQLDTSTPALSGQIRVIPLVQADARVIAATLTALFEQRYAAARGNDVQRNKPIILADPRSNSLLVTANQEDNGTIDDLLKKLDAKTENPALILSVLPLKHNDSARITTMIESIFAARQRAQTLPGQTPLPSDQIKVEADPLNNALIVSASKENLELIQGLLQRIDVEPTIAGGILETFTLQFADVQRVAAMLKSLVDQGLYRPGLPPGAPVKGTSQRDALAISVDQRSNTLMVSASPENLAIVREVIRRVDTKDFSDATNVRLYPLKNARASSLAATLEQFFRAKRSGDSLTVNANERSIPVSVIADDRVNTLLVTGGKEAFDVADRLIQQLDGESVFARMNFKIFPLKKATAMKLQSTLQQIVANRPPKVKGEPVDPITIVADSWVNALLVGASVDDMNIVESLIQRLDSEPAEAGLAIHVYSLAKADARRVAQIVQGLFRDGTPGSTLPVTVSADERMNAIIVSCGEIDAKRVEELIKKLDTEQVARVSEIKVFPLRYAKAESLSSILNAALNTKPVALTEQSPNAQSVLQFITRTEEGKELVTAALKEAILITPDARMNSLIVSGPVDYMGLIEQIISRLDASSPQQAKIKVFTLQNADAHQMADLLMQLFRMTQTVPQTGAQRSIQYTLVRPRVAEDGAPASEEALASATMGTAEQNALSVTVDPRTNSLLVGGTDHYVGLVSRIIESLDSTPANERRTEVIRMKNSQSQEVATAIRTFLDQERQRVTQVLGAEAVGTAQRLLEREVAVVAEPVSNTLLISANPRYFDQLRQIIDTLDEPQPQVLIQVLLAEVTLDALTDLGVEWSYTGKKGDVSYGIGTDFDVKDQLTSMGGFSSAVSGSDFSFLIRALKDDGRLEVLSRPQIVTADNKPASINIGQRIPLITDSRVTERGDTINSFKYEDVGVNLSVTPKISPDGFVKMDIGTTNSAVSSSTVQINASATVPIINQRRATTTVSVQSGQTIIIGGLIATTDDKRVKKVPVLGDIPWLGVLFRSTHTSRDRKELLILLTPQILSNVHGTQALIRTPAEVTREHLDNSRIKDEIQRDSLQRQILDPLFPNDTNAPAPAHREPIIRTPKL